MDGGHQLDSNVKESFAGRSDNPVRSGLTVLPAELGNGWGWLSGVSLAGALPSPLNALHSNSKAYWIGNGGKEMRAGEASAPSASLPGSAVLRPAGPRTVPRRYIKLVFVLLNPRTSGVLWINMEETIPLSLESLNLNAHCHGG